MSEWQTLIGSCKDKEDVDLADTDSHGNTALHVACYRGFVDCIEMFLKDSRLTPEIVNMRNNFKKTAVFEIFEGKRLRDPVVLKMLKMLLNNKDVNLEETNKYGQTVLDIACGGSESPKVLQLLIDDHRITTDVLNKVDIARVDETKKCKILLSRKDLDLKTVNIFDIFSKDESSGYGNSGWKKGRSDLFIKDERMTSEIINKWDENGKTVLMHSTRENQMKLLVREDLDVGAFDKEGITFLHMLCSRDNSIDLLKLLLLHKNMNREVINKKNKDGETPLMIAVKKGQLEYVTEIGKLDIADWDTKNEFGKDLLEVAKNFGHISIVTYLEERKSRNTISQKSNASILAQKLVGDFAKYIEAVETESKVMALEMETENQALEKTHSEEMVDLEKKQAMEKESLKRVHEGAKKVMAKKHKTVLSSHQEKMAEFHAKIQTAVSVATLAPVRSMCQQAMPPPTEIYNCYNGHLVCATCKDKVTTCSICCQAIMGRATAMEQMIRSLLKMN